eukprot:SAG22_NODE_951_length_6344_cov_2.683747_6_plen_238_part_00
MARTWCQAAARITARKIAPTTSPCSEYDVICRSWPASTWVLDHRSDSSRSLVPISSAEASSPASWPAWDVRSTWGMPSRDTRAKSSAGSCRGGRKSAESSSCPYCCPYARSTSTSLSSSSLPCRPKIRPPLAVTVAAAAPGTLEAIGKSGGIVWPRARRCCASVFWIRSICRLMSCARRKDVGWRRSARVRPSSWEICSRSSWPGRGAASHASKQQRRSVGQLEVGQLFITCWSQDF